jgi:hypothetical protein
MDSAWPRSLRLATWKSETIAAGRASRVDIFGISFKTDTRMSLNPQNPSKIHRRKACALQALHRENEDATDASKKRKLNPTGRPIGAVNKAKTLSGNANANSSILNFNFTTSQAQPAPGPQTAGKTPANNKPTDDSIINGNMSDICES